MDSHIDAGAEEAARHGMARSPEWPRVARVHLAKEPRCVCCLPTAPVAPVQVHHVFPFHYCIALGRPDLELDDRNLITLCETESNRPGENHHLLVGHLDSFRSSNLAVVQDASLTFHGMLAEVIKRNAVWLSEVAKRLAPLDVLTTDQRSAFAELMNTRLPKK